MFERYIQHWNLDVDGEPIITKFSTLLPVRVTGEPAMLKILKHDEERTGSQVLAWWNGEGAVRVLGRLDDCLLLERATGERSLAEMARGGEDDVATSILCETTLHLHRHRSAHPRPAVPTLREWFEPLRVSALATDGLLRKSLVAANHLLSTPQDEVLLHGDLHHDNVLDGRIRGWLAIDPKGLWGERTFDYVNILRNPVSFFGADPAQLSRRINVIADHASMQPVRLLQWVVAFCGLSAVWCLEDSAGVGANLQEAESDLAMVESALGLLERS
jgi:streptomycin 6-kinase